MQKRKVCFIITSRIHYGRSKTILEAMRTRDDIELQIILAASAILPQYGYEDLTSIMSADGFFPQETITMTLDGGTSIAMAKTTGLGVIEFSNALSRLVPDIVLLRGDRYEVLAAAIAAAYLNIPVAHIEGGDLSGTIDESVRHAITKLSHIHFTTNEKAAVRVSRMGEKKEYIFNFGDPSLEFIEHRTASVDIDEVTRGVGPEIDFSKPYIMVMQHPVTTEMKKNRSNVEETLKAIDQLGMQTLWFWPNVDAGTDEIAKALRIYREHHPEAHIRFLKSVPPGVFIELLKKAQCLAGNSSAGIKECSYLGVPVVNIGTRQSGRMRAENVIDVDYSSKAILEAIHEQLDHGKYEPSNVYYKKNTGKNIAKVLATVALYAQKQFQD